MQEDDENTDYAFARIQTGNASDSLTAPTATQRATHTPGPWSQTIGPNGYVIAATLMGCAIVLAEAYEDNAVEAGANARLIAAAPDLLAALRDAHAFIAIMFGVGADALIPHVVESPNGVNIKISEVMRNSSAAIAKAEGR